MFGLVQKGSDNGDNTQPYYHSSKLALLCRMGEIIIRIGVELVEKGNPNEAFWCFSKALLLGNSSAAFNMGICYEIGLGVNQDNQQAAEYYKLAAEQGHPTAMYNLGVFHARGLGGHAVDCDEAHRLFVKASALGQQEANNALQMVEAQARSPIDESKMATVSRFNENRVCINIKCVKCNNVVRIGIQCRSCLRWLHFKCAKVGEHNLPDENSIWYCPKCSSEQNVKILCSDTENNMERSLIESKEKELQTLKEANKIMETDTNCRGWATLPRCFISEPYLEINDENQSDIIPLSNRYEALSEMSLDDPDEPTQIASTKRKKTRRKVNPNVKTFIPKVSTNIRF